MGHACKHPHYALAMRTEETAAIQGSKCTTTCFTPDHVCQPMRESLAQVS